MSHLKKLLDWFLPNSCLFCRKLCPLDCCADCAGELPLLRYACPICARPLHDIKQNLPCGVCLTRPPPFNSTIAAFLYQAPITKLIMNLKFGQSLVNARFLGDAIGQKIAETQYYHKILPEVIIPLPLHRIRLKERGFNQAVEISRPLAKRFNLPIELNFCKRIKFTQPQAMLPAKIRQHNISQAFEIIEHFPYKHVAIVDDVITTGYTVHEFAKSLRRAGAQRIDIWCCARAIL